MLTKEVNNSALLHHKGRKGVTHRHAESPHDLWKGRMRRAVAAGALIAIAALGTGGSGEGEGTLTLYSGRSESLVGPIIKQFSEATDIKVAVRYASTPELAATLQEEGDRSPADIFIAQDPGGLGAVEAMFLRLPEGVPSRVPEWARPPEGKWVGLSGRARVVVYNTSKLTEAELPDDIWCFTDPMWRGRIG